MKGFTTSLGTLWVRRFGPAPVRLVALHGFTLHGGMFAELAEELRVGVDAPDLPGHGRSSIEPVTTAAAVIAVAEMLGGHPQPVLLGYSQGARVALQLALAHPKLMSGLVLVSGSPGLNEHERALRRVADETLAARIEDIGMERFVAEWVTNSMTATPTVSAERRAADRAIRLENSATGLAEALRGMGQASVPDSLARIATLPVPVIFVAGQRDSKYSELAAAMAAARGTDPVLIAGSGHNVVLEAPQELATIVRSMLTP